MSDILSQAEIDELLNALSAGSEAELKPEPDVQDSIKVYDFRTANRFPKEQIRTLNIVFQNFAQLFSNRLTGLLRTTCECDVLSVEEMSFNEFNNSLPSPVVMTIFRALPMRGSLIMEISPECAYMVINRLLGGSVANSDSGKQFTEIELTLLERVLRQVLRIFNEAWTKILDVEAQVERIETSTQFTQIVALNEPVAAVTLNVKIGNEEGLISICIPHTAIQPISKQLNTRMWYSTNISPQQDEGLSESLREKLIHTPVSMLAYFQNTPATVVDIINLQVGDVIRLNHKTKDPLMVKVQHIPKFYAKIGTSGSQYAVQILDIIKEEIEDESFAR